MADWMMRKIVPGITAIVFGDLWGTVPVMAQSVKPLRLPEASPTETRDSKIDCTSVSPSSYYGHLPYTEAPEEELVSIGNGERLRRTAAASFRRMQATAAKEGIVLVPLSGFRDRIEQTSLFFDIAAARGQSLQERARTSAPPGYSEHHTGYAVDIGDGNDWGGDLNVAFEDTAAGQWLLKNAGRYGFELSFPRHVLCVNYEPWHWRWVGDPDSEQTFQNARDPYRDQRLLGQDSQEW